MLVKGKLLSEREAAEILGIAPITLNRRRREGHIGFFRIGARVLYDYETHLLPFLKGQEVTPREVEDGIN